MFVHVFHPADSWECLLRFLCFFVLLQQVQIHKKLLQMVKVFGLLVLLTLLSSLSNSFECDENGYNKYLNNYYFKQGESNDYKELDV